MAAAKATLEQPRDQQTNWFAEAEPMLAPLRRECSRLYQETKRTASTTVRLSYKVVRKAYKQALQAAKDLYCCNQAKKVRWRDIIGDSRKAWQIVRQIEKGSFAHHQPVDQDMVLTDPATGKPTSDPATVIGIIGEYTHKLYNRDDAPIDPTALDDIEQRQIHWTLADPPTLEEMRNGIYSLSNNKAPGASKVPAEAFKALPKKAMAEILPIFTRFFTNDIPNGIYEEWETAILKLLYKNKGSAKKLKNYRGIVLQDLFARIMSAIIADRLALLLQKNGIEQQFGCQKGRGTIDANWVIRNLLQTRKLHGIDSHVLFVDLIKAFDTANHDLLFDLLGKFGAPPPLVDAIRRLHTDFKLEFKLDKKHQCTIDYTVGVRQGDNMAPVLFLFLVQAFAESTNKAWLTEHNRELPSMRYPEPDETLIRGELLNQKNPKRAKGRVVELPFTIFVDDTAFVFDSREELAANLPFLHKQFARFGLLMHVGTINQSEPDPVKRLVPSKTECMFFPARPIKATDCSTRTRTHLLWQ